MQYLQTCSQQTYLHLQHKSTAKKPHLQDQALGVSPATLSQNEDIEDTVGDEDDEGDKDDEDEDDDADDDDEDDNDHYNDDDNEDDCSYAVRLADAPAAEPPDIEDNNIANHTGRPSSREPNPSGWRMHWLPSGLAAKETASRIRLAGLVRESRLSNPPKKPKLGHGAGRPLTIGERVGCKKP